MDVKITPNDNMSRIGKNSLSQELKASGSEKECNLGSVDDHSKESGC